MSYFFLGLFWVLVYLALVLLPPMALLLGEESGGSGFWWDFSLALGFSGTAMVGTLFLQTARFQRASAPFGIDIIYYFHRQSSLLAFAFILMHPILLLYLDPGLWELMKPSMSNWPFLSGAGSLLALAILLISSLWRKSLQIHYDLWRIVHACLAFVALALAIVHILGLGHYLDVMWKRVTWCGVMAAWLWLLIYIRLIKPRLLLRHPFRVTGVREERGDAWTLYLSPSGHDGFCFQPGQFAWLTIWSSPFALKEHPFSIASSAEKPKELSFTIKDLGDFTCKIKNVLIGQTVYVDGPYGCFSTDREPASKYIFIAGGIGIAPIMGMLRTLADRKESAQIVLFYAYNTWERLTFREELKVLQDKLNLRLIFVLNEPHKEWQGETGLISKEILERHLPTTLNECEYFICGPVPMITLTEKLLNELGVALRKIHSELFDLV